MGICCVVTALSEVPFLQLTGNGSHLEIALAGDCLTPAKNH